MDIVASPKADRLAGLIEARYREKVTVPADLWSPAIDTILSHRSIRNYLDKPLPDGLVETIVAAAQSAPSSSNLQLWSVVAVSDPARKARLGELAAVNRHIAQAPLLLVFVADLSRARHIASTHAEPGEGLDYLESFLLAAVDTALAAQNAVVALDSLGLGSCYIGAIRNQPEPVAAELGLPPESVALFGLTIGYPDPAAGEDVKPRLPQRAVLHRETYDRSSPDLASYDAALSAFQAEQKVPIVGWTPAIAKRIGTAAALRGRTELTAILRRLGFGLK